MLSVSRSRREISKEISKGRKNNESGTENIEVGSMKFEVDVEVKVGCSAHSHPNKK